MDSAGDATFGRGLQNLFIDSSDGVGQVVMTRLRLFLGDWFLDQSQGTAWRTQVLGNYTGATRDMVVRTRVLGTPSVTGITAYSSSLNRDTRAWSVQATISTQYGATTITGSV